MIFASVSNTGLGMIDPASKKSVDGWGLVRKIIKYLADFGGFLTLLGLAVGQIVADKKAAVWLTLLALSALVAAGGVSTLWRGRRWVSARQYAVSVASLVLSVLVVGLAGYNLASLSRHVDDAPSIRFGSHPAPLKGCEDFRGEGTIRDGFSLLIFVQAVDRMGAGFGDHYLAGVAIPQSNGWLVSDFHAGDVNKPIKLEAVTVGKKEADAFVQAHFYRYSDPGPNLSDVGLRLPSLPADPVDSIILNRDDSTLGCRPQGGAR